MENSIYMNRTNISIYRPLGILDTAQLNISNPFYIILKYHLRAKIMNNVYDDYFRFEQLFFKNVIYNYVIRHTLTIKA